MTPSQARRRIWILRIAAGVLWLYAIPTFGISALKMLYATSWNIKLVGLLADLIAALYNSVFRGSTALEFWWANAPVPDTDNLFAATVYFLAHPALIVAAYFIWDHAAHLTHMRNEAKRQRQIREWVDHPDD